MRVHVRFSLLALLVGAIVFVSAPAAAQAAFGVEKFFALNCEEGFETCGEGAEAPSKKEAEEEGYTQAAGHPPFGVTDFKVNTEGTPGKEIPVGTVQHIRTDVAPGVSTNPEAVPKCSLAELGTEVSHGFFVAPTCSSNSIIGKNKVLVYVEAAGGDVPLEGSVYNLVQQEGNSSEFGAALKFPEALTKVLFKGTLLENVPLYAHTIIEGHVEWASDYHDYFEIKVSPALPLISSRLVFFGNIGEAGKGSFLANPSSCTGIGPQTTSTLTLESTTKLIEASKYEAPIGTEGCNGLPPFEPVPFAPKFAIAAGNTQQDQPNGPTAELGLPHNVEPEEVDSSQMKTATFTLPEGLTLNPSAANGLKACTPAQARIHSHTPGVECPTESSLGNVKLEVPGLPAGSLTGNVYLGGPETGPITAPPYTVYVDAESKRYGISVRVEGSVEPNPATGQLVATFANNPEQPFTKLTIEFRNDQRASLANSLTCGTATAKAVLTPFTGTAATEPASSFTVDGNGSGGACASPVPFAPAQGVAPLTGNAGAAAAFTVNLERKNGEQYLSHVSTTLPSGMVGAIPKVAQCTEAQANTAACPPASAIGTANVLAGSGSEPFLLAGTVYLTGPYNGAPYGMDIEVPVVAGPFNLGTAVTRLGIYVDQTTGRITTAGYLPSIVYGGVPTRLKQASVTINRPGFLTNPTSCQAEAVESTVTGSPGTGSPGTSVNLSTPFQAANCNSLKFKPSFKATTSGRTSKKYGASIETTINQPAGQANIKSVTVQLPKQLPSRLTTLQKACPQATFQANPLTCPVGSLVGGARANTPTLPGKLSGPAYLVSHAGAAFPDLDLVLQANGVRVILVGNTNIKNGITTTKFASTPDVPVSSITVNLPLGEHSALAAFGNLCTQPLIMPTTMVAQNGLTIKQNTRINPVGCRVQIVGHKVIGNTAYITVAVPAAGRISGSGPSLATVYRHLGSATQATTLKVPLSRGGQRRGRPFRVRLRVGYVPKQRRRGNSAATVTVTFG